MREPSITRSRSPRLAMLSSLVGLAGILAMLALSLINEYQNASQHAQIEVENISRLLEEHVLETVQKVDLLVRDVQERVRPNDMRLAREEDTPLTKELHALLKFNLEKVPDINIIVLSNLNGERIYTSNPPTSSVNIADRAYFQRQRNDPTAGLVISSPIVSRNTGKWSMTLSRRINFEDGSFAGTVHAALNLEYFQHFYRTLNLGPQGLVALYDKELHLAARYPSSEKDMGKISNLYARTFIEKGIKYATYHTKSPVDGVERLYGFRQVGDLPLLVFAGIAEDDYLAEWYRHIWQYGAGAVIFSLMVIALALRQRRAEEALLKSEERFRLISTAAKDAIIIIGPAEEITYWNPAAETIFGYKADEVLGKYLHKLIVPPRYRDHARRGYEDFSISGQGTVVGRTIEMTALRKNGKEFPVELSISALRIKDRWHALGTIRDITERKASEEKIRQLAYYDTLTKLPNRRLLLDRINQSLFQAARHQRSMAVMFLDLDRFKNINDTLGHEVGDELLKAIALRLDSCVRTGDTVSRQGGDEFVIVLAEINHQQDAARVAEKIIDAFVQPVRVNGNELVITASIGIAVYTGNQADDTQELLRKADMAMYAVKEAGRNSYRFYQN